MDETTVIMKARDLLRRVRVTGAPVKVEIYLEAFGCELKREKSLAPGESGCFFEHKGKRFVVVSDNDSEERQRFTVCHEIAHIDLGLADEHGAPSWSYSKRPPNEILCDVYATELLLPSHIFRPLAAKTDAGFAAINELAEQFQASITSTGSRYAAEHELPCAFVLCEQGRVRHAARSKALREMGAWIRPGATLPSASAAAAARSGIGARHTQEIAADVWFSEWRKGGVLLEEARHLSKFDQTLSLLWFDDGDEPHEERSDEEYEEDRGLLRELDGKLPWPGKKRRR